MLVPLYPPPNPAPANLFPTNPCENAQYRVTGQKQQIKGPNFAVSSLQRFILEKWPCWALARLLPGSIGSHPPGQLVGGKVGGSLHQENNYIKKKLGEALTLSFAPQPVNSSRLH